MKINKLNMQRPVCPDCKVYKVCKDVILQPATENDQKKFFSKQAAMFYCEKCNNYFEIKN